MIQINNHLFEGPERSKLLNKYKYIVFDTNEIETAKTIFKSRFLTDIDKIKIRRPISDPSVEYYSNLGYRITYTANFDGSENYDIVSIEVPSIDINEFEFIPIETIQDISSETLLFISKYQILWDKIYLSIFL